VTARHLVAVDPGAVERVLGPGTTLDDARTYLRDALGANSRATLAAAGAPAEGAAP
jgi:aromatase